MRTSVKPYVSVLNPEFIAKNVLTGMASFVAPFVAAAAALATVNRSDIDILKAVARMRHPDRMGLSAREAVLKDADESGLSIDQTFDSMHLSPTERKSLLHILEREREREHA